MKYKKLNDNTKKRLEHRIKLLLSAGLDYCKNTNKGQEYWFSPNNPYYCEAFGVMHALQVLEYGFIGADNVDTSNNLKYWFNQLKDDIEHEGLELGEHEIYAKYRNYDVGTIK